jgi:hypothetical protein
MTFFSENLAGFYGQPLLRYFFGFFCAGLKVERFLMRFLFGNLGSRSCVLAEAWHYEWCFFGAWDESWMVLGQLRLHGSHEFGDKRRL